MVFKTTIVKIQMRSQKESHHYYLHRAVTPAPELISGSY